METDQDNWRQRVVVDYAEMTKIALIKEGKSKEVAIAWTNVLCQQLAEKLSSLHAWPGDTVGLSSTIIGKIEFDIICGLSHNHPNPSKFGQPKNSACQPVAVLRRR